MARDLALALGAAHDANIIHRDVKPRNLLVYSLDEVKVTDFGIAYDPEDTTITTMDPRVGPDWFGPPEMFDRSHEPTPAFDVFSLGRVIYVMLSGGPRFGIGHGVGDDDLCVRLRRGELVEVNRFLDKMLAPKHLDRLQNMGDVVAAIDGVLDALSVRPRRSATGCQMCEGGAYVDAGTLSWERPAGLSISRDGVDFGLGTFRPHLLVCNSCGDTCLRLGNIVGLASLPLWSPQKKR